MSVLHPKGKRYVLAETFNRNFICKICKGYLIRPVAITECLHTFCRSCIVKYLENASQYNCPDCERQIHETNPWDYLREDKTLEEIIFKLVPGLWKSEKWRRVQFYSSRGLPVPEEIDLECVPRPSTPTSEFVRKSEDETQDREEDPKDTNTNKQDQKLSGNSQIGFQLSYLECSSLKRGFRQLDRRFIRCSAYLTIEHLKKYLKLKLNLPDNYELDILCNGEIMGKHHTLEFIYMTRWRFMDTLLSLDYRPKIELTEL